jgi:circadian clock protein KaiB
MIKEAKAPGGVPPPGSPPPLTLFVLGRTETVRRAIANARTLGPLTIVDVRDDPAAAEAARILATPTLVRMDDTPARIVGDLSDMAAVRAHLGPPFDGPEAGAADG